MGKHKKDVTSVWNTIEILGWFNTTRLGFCDAVI
jgi:hypothetical protein